MKLEDRLSGAMHEYADRIEPEAGSWEQITARFDESPTPAPKRPARGPLVLAGVALALIVVLITTLVVRDNDGTRVVTKPGDPPPTEPAAPVPAPLGMLVARRTGELVVLGTQDGQQHSSLGSFPGIRSVSTSPDGRAVFYVASGQSGACGKGDYFDVNKLVPATGQTTPVVGGSGAAAVSPDGKFIAVGVSCDGPSLGFTSLVTGQNYGADALGSLTTERSPGIKVVDPLGWSPDSTRLVYRVHLESDDVPRYYVGRLWPVVPQAQTQVIALPNGSGVSTAAWIDDDTVALAEPLDTKTEIRRWTVSTGADEIPSPVLFEVPGRVTSLVSDGGGQHFLALTEAGELYRWSRGEDQPTKVASDVAAATWLPWS